MFILFFFSFCATGQPTITRDGAMGNETFYWDGLSAIKLEAARIHFLIAVPVAVAVVVS